ncbi:MAG: NBR1-Ig-like domain-containing protein, partial [Candidatus Promineifilaceae bacterium]
DYELPGMLAYLQYCADNPEKAALSVHEYTWNRWTFGESWPNWYPTLWGRVEAAIAAADKHNIPRTFAIFMTEWGFAHEDAPRWPQCEPYLTDYNEWAARWRLTNGQNQVKGVAAWTLQAGWGDVDDDLQSWFTHLADYVVDHEFDPGEQPARTHLLFGDTVPGQQPPNGGGVPGWPPPAEPLADGWGFAQSIEQQQDLGKIIFPDGINVREQPDQNADSLGRIPAGTIVRITGATQNDYYPIQVTASLLDGTGDPNTQYTREFISFNSTADLNNLQPFSQFQATWVLRNTGTAVWNGNFRLDYSSNPLPENANTVLSSMGPDTFSLHDLSGVGEVLPGQTVSLTFNFKSPMTPRTYASHWLLKTDTGIAVGNPLWIRGVVKGDPVGTPIPTGIFQPGMNINPDAHSLDIERLEGLKWVRWVYKAAAVNRNVDQAFNDQYRNLIQSYANAGIKSLIILNQETVWGNAPWHNGDWATFAGSLAHAAGRIAELCAVFGDSVTYQIWNEEDSPPTNQSAIGISASNYATILGPTAAAIRAKHAGAAVIFGGLNSGPDSGAAYAKSVREKLGGSLPVDALAIHPYGRYVHNDPFYNQQFGRLQDALAVWKQNFPTTPIWMTEIGIADDNPIGPANYQKIADYMREIFTEVANNHGDQVPVLIWFAWSDWMRNAGITTKDGQMKAHIGDAYQEFVERGMETAAPPAPAAAPAFAAETMMRGAAAPAIIPPSNAAFLNFETTLEDYTAVPAGSTFTNRWTYRNTGSSTWGDGFMLVYS